MSKRQDLIKAVRQIKPNQSNNNGLPNPFTGGAGITNNY